jgi:hypothetical protein
MKKERKASLERRKESRCEFCIFLTPFFCASNKATCAADTVLLIQRVRCLLSFTRNDQVCSVGGAGAWFRSSETCVLP